MTNATLTEHAVLLASLRALSSTTLRAIETMRAFPIRIYRRIEIGAALATPLTDEIMRASISEAEMARADSTTR